MLHFLFLFFIFRKLTGFPYFYCPIEYYEINPEKRNIVQLEAVIGEMEAVFEPAPYGISHTMKVLDNVRRMIQVKEPDYESAMSVELTAILHDTYHPYFR